MSQVSFALTSALLLVLIASSCGPQPLSRQELLEYYIPAEGAVGFDIQPATGPPGQSWTAIHTSQGKIAKFRIELGSATVSEAKDAKDFKMSFGKGAFLPESGSNPSAFLAELKKALEAKTLPTKVQKIPRLPFEYVGLGVDQSRNTDGSFSSSPKGHWTVTKIFLANGEGEVFLNFNQVTNKAEFSIKDSDYGDIVLRELAKIL